MKRAHEMNELAQPRSQARADLGASLRNGGYRFVTPTPLTHARNNRRPRDAWAGTLTDVFGWSRPFRDGLVPDRMFEQMRAAGVLEPAGAGSRSPVRLPSMDELLVFHSAYPTTACDVVSSDPIRTASPTRSGLTWRRAGL